MLPSRFRPRSRATLALLERLVACFWASAASLLKYMSPDACL